jgi:hypothetical protein
MVLPIGILERDLSQSFSLRIIYQPEINRTKIDTPLGPHHEDFHKKFRFFALAQHKNGGRFNSELNSAAS